MQAENAPLEDDPVFAMVRDARPAAPLTLERDVLAQLDARPRARRTPLVVGALVACAALVCAVILIRGGGEQSGPVATGEIPRSIDAGSPAGPADATTPADAPPGPPAPPAPPAPSDWTNLAKLWADLEKAHYGKLARCVATSAKVAINVERGRDGTARAFHPLPGLGGRGPTVEERCLSGVVEAIQLPAMPVDLQTITLVMSVPPVPLPQPAMDAWRDPVRTLHDVFDGNLRALRACAGYGRTLTFIVDRGSRVRVPRYQFSGEKAYGTPTIACFDRAFATMTMPELPPIIGEVQVSYRFQN